MSWTLYGKTFESRLLLGTSLYPSPEIMQQAIVASRAEIITVSIRRQQQSNTPSQFWQFIKELNCTILPNTAGCYSAKQAIKTAMLARELFNTSWIKLEVIANDHYLNPESFGLVEAAKTLVAEGFQVFPYCTDDLCVAQRLLDVGCELLMPWAAPIGSAQGILNPYNMNLLRQRYPDINLIVDAGLGRPSDATIALEMGFDGILLNSAVANANDPVLMARAFAAAVNAGRDGYQAGLMPKRELAQASTTMFGVPFSE